MTKFKEAIQQNNGYVKDTLNTLQEFDEALTSMDPLPLSAYLVVDGEERKLRDVHNNPAAIFSLFGNRWEFTIRTAKLRAGEITPHPILNRFFIQHSTKTLNFRYNTFAHPLLSEVLKLYMCTDGLSIFNEFVEVSQR